MPIKYVRDKRSPVPLNKMVSKVMSANKSKHTKPEITFRKTLWDNGIRGYRLNWRKVPGSPDIAFIRQKLAIFINGCFWHRCPKCELPLPKSNTEFWKDKFNKNVKRDKKKNMQLINFGWRVLVIWECDIKSNIRDVILEVRQILESKN